MVNIHQKSNYTDGMVSECGIFDKFAMNYGTSTDDGRDMQWEYSVDAESGADILFNSSEVLRDASLKRQRHSSDAQENSILPPERFSQYSTGTDTAQKNEKGELETSKFFDLCDSDSPGVDETADIGLEGSVGQAQSRIRPLHADTGLGGGLFDHFRCPK